MTASAQKVNAAIQGELARRRLSEVAAVEAARWLDQAGILRDSPARPGRPLRGMLRTGQILGSEQRPPKENGRWFINRQPDGLGHREAGGSADASSDAEEATELAVPGDSAEFAEPRSSVPALSRMAELEAQAALALEVLGCSMPVIDTPCALPDEPGLYSFAASMAICKQLGLPDIADQRPLCDGPLYVGKSEDSIRSRVVDTHLAVGETGRSTVRRTLASLLGLPGIPRPTKLKNPTRKQMMQRTANFALGDDDDIWLSEWMAENLEIRGTSSSYRPLRDLERIVGAQLRPPLDQERVPLWSPNPWRAQVAAARDSTRRELRRTLGLLDGHHATE